MRKLHRLVGALVSRRRALDLHRKAAAQLGGIGPGTVGRWEVGATEPQLIRACAYGGGLGLRLAVVNPRTKQTLASEPGLLVPAVVAYREREGIAARDVALRMRATSSWLHAVEEGRPVLLLSADRYVATVGLLLVWVFDRPRCCGCDPYWCRKAPREHCPDQSCGRCLHGCPAPDGVECCEAAVPARAAS